MTPSREWDRVSRDLLFAAAGGLSLTLQVQLVRELTVDLGGDESAIGLGLASWLLGIGAGAWAVHRRTPERARRAAAPVLAALAIAGPLLVALGRILRAALAPAAGQLLDLDRAIVLAALTLTPAGALVGIGFTSLAAIGAATGRGVARLYVFESIGALVGGSLASVACSRVSPLVASLAAGAIAIAAWCPAAFRRQIGGRVALPLLALALFALVPFTGPADLALERARFAALAPGVPFETFRHTPYQQLALGNAHGDRYLYSSGQFEAQFPDPASGALLANTIALLAPRPSHVVSLGGIETGALRALLKHPVVRVTIVDPDRDAHELVRSVLDPADRAALDDPRVTVVHDDPRRFLARATDKFELILLLQPAPVTLQRARFTTVEFYRVCASRLAHDGVLVASLDTTPTALEGDTAALAGSIFAALRDAFPVVHATPGPDTLLVAGHDAAAVTLDPEVLTDRWVSRRIDSTTFAPALLFAQFAPQRVADEEQALALAASHTDPSRDNRPVPFFHALARRQHMQGGIAAHVLALASRTPDTALATLLLLPSALLALFAPRLRTRRPSLAGVHLAAATGAAGMAWSLVTLLAFQAREGALYGQLGLLTAAFMFGLALGGTLARRTAEVSTSGRPEEQREAYVRATRALVDRGTAAVLVGIAVPIVIRALAASSALAGSLSLAAYAVLFLVEGLATGQLFPAAVGALLAVRTDATFAAGRIEAADHFGASAGLIATVLVVPRFGFTGVTFVIAAWLGLAWLGAVRARA